MSGLISSTRLRVTTAALVLGGCLGVASVVTAGQPFAGAASRCAGPVIHGYCIAPGAHLVGAKLAGANLSFTNLTGADLAGANLTGAQVASAHLAGVNLSGAILTGVRSGAIIGKPASLPNTWSLVSGYLVGPGASLVRAHLSGTKLTGAHLAGADLSAAYLSGVASGSIVGAPAALPAAWSLSRGYLLGPGADLIQAKLSGAALGKVHLAGAYLIEANLSGAQLMGADLERANLSSANFSRANLSGANLHHAVAAGANFSGARFSSATICPNGQHDGAAGANCG